ncbi:MAG TPA: hypothetical protein V6C78_00125 [Crinalium sp.]
MSFISKLIGGFFAFLGGFFKGLLGLVGVGKKSEYFLEAKDSEEAKPAPAPAPAPAKAEPVATPALASAEPTNGKAPVAAPAAPAPVAAAPTPAAPAPAPQPVAAASNGSSPTKTFAPDFLLTPSSSSDRRRPGPSLNRFIDMARKVNS